MRLLRILESMHLNGDSSMENPSDENHEMLELESQDAAGRIADLERKVLEQGDELVCLKASLAEVLRRISILEGMRLSQQPSQPSTPLRLNGSSKDLPMRSRPVSYSASKVDVNRRYAGLQSSALPQRRAVHYQSTGSLHSDSQSSSSVSPIPSPSPRATPQPLNGNGGRRPISVIGNSTSSSIVSTPTTNNSPLHKRWSSTGDFNQIPSGAVSPAPSSVHSKYSNKSFLNLFKTNSSSSTPAYKHGTNSATYNIDDRVLKIYFRGKNTPLYAPTLLADNYDITKVSTAPSRKLKLDWVYGYRGKDCRSNLYSLPTGEMVYFVAAVVVLYNVEEQHQRHYLEHTSDVKSLALHPNKMLIATSQCAGSDKSNSRAHIRIWNSISLHTQAVIGMNDFNLSWLTVCCMSFSKLDGGALLVAVDENIDHTISVWDWQRGDSGYRIAETKCSVDTIVSAEFHPLDRNTIVTCGKSHIAFWSLDATGVLFKRMGVFETRDKPKYVTCVAFLQTGETITGDSNGNLQVWGRGTNTIWKFIKNVHEGGVFSICVQRDGTVLTGGGKDGKIIEFGSNLARTGLFGEIEGHFGGIRVISEGKGSQLLVGTTRNCILWGSLELGFQPIILGHTDDLWGLAVHPVIPQFATAGYDRVLQLWESMSHSILWSKDIGEAAQCVAFSHNGSNIIVGTVSGKWMVFDTQSRDLLATFADGNKALQVIQFSPDGTLIALGSRDNNIYVYQVSDDGTKYARVGKCVGHSGFITHMDWSLDNQTLRSNSADFELLFWNTGTCRQIPQATLTKDVEWATNTCPITFTTIGIWPETAEGADVNCCDRSHDSKLMVTADEMGKVKLYNYPVIQPKSLCQSYGCHSSTTTAIKFLYDDTRAVSIGGKDTAVLQWTVS